MSITNEITRLQTAKADIKAAIEAKGVTVPSGSTLDDFADLVEAIQTGGGGDGYFQLLNTITITENVHAINVVLSDYANRELVIVTDLTLSQVDWMYYVRNGTEPSGGVYDQNTITKNGVAFMRFYNPSSTNLANYIASGNGFNGNNSSVTVNNFYMYPYAGETMILAGGKIYIYGGRTI